MQRAPQPCILWQTNLLMGVELPENLSGIQEMLLLVNPVQRVSRCTSVAQSSPHILLRVPDRERQVQHKRQPVAIDKEEERQEAVNSGLGDDVGVETVAQVDWVDVVAANVRQPKPWGIGAATGAFLAEGGAYHSKSLYMMVKKT